MSLCAGFCVVPLCAVCCCAGLKNKNKSKKVQQYVKAVETSVAFAGQSTKQRREDEKLKAAKEAMKANKEAMEMEKAALFKSVVNKTVVPAGVDPKSVVCEFYKAGKCVRGAKCKVSWQPTPRRQKHASGWAPRRDWVSLRCLTVACVRFSFHAASLLPVVVSPSTRLAVRSSPLRASLFRFSPISQYSHDVEQARKVAKIDLYSDPRHLDSMDQWDTAKLEQVVGSKLKGKLPPTDIGQRTQSQQGASEISQCCF